MSLGNVHVSFDKHECSPPENVKERGVLLIYVDRSIMRNLRTKNCWLNCKMNLINILKRAYKSFDVKLYWMDQFGIRHAFSYRSPSYCVLHICIEVFDNYCWKTAIPQEIKWMKNGFCSGLV